MKFEGCFLNVIKYLLALCFSFLVTSQVALSQGLNTGNLTLIPNDADTQSITQTVTMGIPFAPCTVIDSNNGAAGVAARIDQFKLLNGGAAEVATYLEETLTWPARNCGAGMEESTRALKVQFIFDATDGIKNYSWNLTGRALADIGVQTIIEFDTDKVGTKGALKEPVVFAIHDPDYLVQSQIMPPSVSLTGDSYDTDYYPTQWANRSRDLDYTLNSAAHWLFDRVTTNYRQALRRGAGISNDDPEYYREAYLSHEFYVDHIDNVDGTNSNNCIGSFTLGTLNCDSKFNYLENMKLHLALTGDDSWAPAANPYMAAGDRQAMFKQMADILVRGDNRAISTICLAAGLRFGVCEDYDEVADKMTERHAGFTLQTVQNSCELTGDTEVCGWADDLIDRFYSHMTSNPDGFGNDGTLRHSWNEHEGNRFPFVGNVASTGGNTWTVSNAIGDISKLHTGVILRTNSGPLLELTLTADATDLGGGVWQFTTDDPQTKAIGTLITSPDLSVQTDRAFSPWMSAILADGVWQYYHYTQDSARKLKAKEMLQGFGRAMAAYGFDAIRMNPATKTSIESAFGVTVFKSNYPDTDLLLNDTSNPACTALDRTTGHIPFPRYVATTLMNTDPNTSQEYLDWLSSGDNDQHNPDTLFLIALGLFFETDPVKRAAFEAIGQDILLWFDAHVCTAPAGGGTIRIYNWQNKQDPFGTYKWVKSFAISYDTDTFVENLANDGTIGNSLTLTLGGAKFSKSSGNFTEGVDYTITGIPGGFAGATLTATSDSTATLTLNGAATAHLLTDNVNNIALTFLDAAFADGFEASRIANSAKTDISTQYRNPELTYVSDTFNESAANDGSIANSIVVNLTNDTFPVASLNLTETLHYTVSNKPAGLTVQIAIDADSDEATISLTGSADAHANINDLSNFGITFTDAAFVISTAAGVTGSSKTDLDILFVEPALDYSGTTFNEDAGSNDGSIANSLTIMLSDDTFAVPAAAMTAGVHYTVAEIPAGLTAVVTGTSATTATLSLSGNATNHGNTDEAADADLTLNFLPAAFTTTTSVANITNASKADLNVLYVEPSLLYGSMIFNENASSNDGSILNNVTINLSDDTFVVSGGVMTEGVHYVVGNVPANLTAVVTGTSATTATLALTGNAVNHGNADEISNLSLNFLPAAFTTSNSVTNINDASKTNLQILNVEPAIAYSMGSFSENPGTNDGSITDTLVLTLTDDLFVNAGGTLSESTHYTVANLPAGLTLNVAVNGGGTAITLSLTGMATAHVDASDVSDFAFTLLPAAFVNSSSTANIANAAKSDIVVDFLEQGISYNFNTFVESNANNGSIGTVLTLSLVAETFVINAGAMTVDTHYTVANVPIGLTAVVTGTSSNTATLALTGNAASSTSADDINNLTLAFLDAAFAGGDASAITNATKSDLAVDFVDANLSYSSSAFNEAGADDGSITNTITLTLTVDTFTVPAGPMTATTHYNVANVPAGLTAVVTGTSTSSATVALTGNAASHANSDDVANLTLTFLDAAFTNGDASNVNNSSNAAIIVNFADPAPAGGGGASGGGSTSGTVTGLSVDPGASVTNSGTLVDLNNAGTVTGGTVSGNVTNSAGASLVDVQLASGTTVTGGTVRGRISGSGTLVGAVVDASFVASSVKLGAGSKVTANTASTVPGLVLTDAVRGENGALKLSQPLLVDANNNEISALQIAEQEINQLFGSESQTGDSSDDGLVVISNTELGGLVVPVAPQSVVTTNEPNGVTLNDKGELVVIGMGIKTTFGPSSADLAGFQAGIEANGATTDLLSDGRVFVELSGNTISLRFSLVATTPTDSSAISSLRALSSGATTFSVNGSVAAPASYRIIAHYADGSSQELLPTVHDLTAFDAWMQSAGYSSVTDGLTGFISVKDEAGVTIWRGIPDYSLLPPDSAASNSVDFSAATDLNGDGIGDMYFHTDQWKQVLYGLPK